MLATLIAEIVIAVQMNAAISADVGFATTVTHVKMVNVSVYQIVTT